VCFTATARFIAVDVEHSAAHGHLGGFGAFGDMLKRFAGSNGDRHMTGQEKGAWWWQ
jgi:hypothetical protein